MANSREAIDRLAEIAPELLRSLQLLHTFHAQRARHADPEGHRKHLDAIRRIAADGDDYDHATEADDRLRRSVQRSRRVRTRDVKRQVAAELDLQRRTCETFARLHDELRELLTPHASLIAGASGAAAVKIGPCTGASATEVLARLCGLVRWIVDDGEVPPPEAALEAFPWGELGAAVRSELGIVQLRLAEQQGAERDAGKDLWHARRGDALAAMRQRGRVINADRRHPVAAERPEGIEPNEITLREAIDLGAPRTTMYLIRSETSRRTAAGMRYVDGVAVFDRERLQAELQRTGGRGMKA